MLNCEIMIQRNQQWRIWSIEMLQHPQLYMSAHSALQHPSAEHSRARGCKWNGQPSQGGEGRGLFVVSRQIRETPTARQQPPPTSSHYWLSCVAPAAPACCRSQHANSLHQAQHEQRSSWAGASHHFALLETCKCQDLPSRAAAETKAPCHSSAPDG